MDAYRWTVVAADMQKPPVSVGITGDREQAQADAGSALLGSRRAIVAVVEAVRPALLAPGVDPGYEPTGLAWTGRRTRGGAVHWAERTPPP